MMTKLQFGVTIDMTVKEFRIPFRINVDTFAEDGKADRDGRKFLSNANGKTIELPNSSTITVTTCC